MSLFWGHRVKWLVPGVLRGREGESTLVSDRKSGTVAMIGLSLLWVGLVQCSHMELNLGHPLRVFGIPWLAPPLATLGSPVRSHAQPVLPMVLPDRQPSAVVVRSLLAQALG